MTKTQNITGIIVSYNTADLLRACVQSIRKFYPELKLIIIDGSDADNECCTYAASLRDDVTHVETLHNNIGHGNGMKKGIELCTTDYFLLIDSDTEIIKGGIIELMLAVFCPSKISPLLAEYGVGVVVGVDKNGHNKITLPNYPYLHPHFALIKRSSYYAYAPIIHHGAPMIKSMLDIAAKKDTMGLINYSDMPKYVLHKGRGTRALNPAGFHPGTWE